ncbi:MAG: biotin/lipoyl-binding protein [Chloroflexi bacterium]|nr:biotin/lipoyl-binding protein [Chloroflexota bacterium]
MRMSRAQRVTATTGSGSPDAESFTIHPGESLNVTEATALGSGVTVGHIGRLDRQGRRPVEVVVDGWRFEVFVEDEARAALRDLALRDRTAYGTAGGPLEIRAIIPGRVASVAVAQGDAVEAGQTLVAVEAMKMQNELVAPRAGTVTRVPAAVGATVELGDILVVVE